MRKIKYLIFSLLMIIPLGVYAAEKPKVSTLETTVTSKTIKYNGTMGSGSTAVMCKLYDSYNTELDKLSSAVDATKFNGEFTVEDYGDYKIACANYEGGAIKEVNVTVERELTKIHEVKLTFTKPEIGSKVEKDEDNMPTLRPTITADNEAVTVGAFYIVAPASDEDPEQDLFFGTLEENGDYHLFIDLYLGPESADYEFADDLKVTVEGLEDYTLSANGSARYTNVYASFKLTKEEPKEETNDDTESPNTGDKLLNYVIILSIGVIGAVLGIVYFKKNKLSK